MTALIDRVTAINWNRLEQALEGTEVAGCVSCML